MFSGVAGFENGIQQAFFSNARVKKEQVSTDELGCVSDSCEQNGNWGEQRPVCVGVCEWDKYAKQVLKKQFPGVKNYDDATKIKTSELPDFDMLVGGTPCQDFSIAGKRKGLTNEDGTLTRSGLFHHFLRVAEDKKPKLVLLENVKGMLSSKNKEGEYNFVNMMEALCKAGYVIDFTVLNSKNFGVAQNRERARGNSHHRVTITSKGEKMMKGIDLITIKLNKVSHL